MKRLSSVLLLFAWACFAQFPKPVASGRPNAVPGIQSGEYVYCESAVGTDAYACNLTPAILAYTTGMVVNLKADVANTGACSLALNGLAAKAIKRGHDVDPADGEIEIGQVVTVVYDGTTFQMQSQTALDQATAIQTLTNKTIDAEGTGNVITTVSYLTIPGFAFKLPTALAPAIVSIEGTNTILDTLEFPDADGDYSAQFSMPLPPDWAGDTVAAAIRWAPAAAATGNVVWQLATTCVAVGETVDKAYNAAQTVTSTPAAGTEFVDASIASVTMTGCALNEELWLKILRNRTHASDTLNQKPQLNWVQLKVRRAQ